MTTQLSTAVRAGLPLLNCLELLRKQQRKPGMRRMFEHLTKAVSGGMSLSEAMGEHKEVFSPLYLSMIRVGETGGILEQTSAAIGHDPRPGREGQGEHEDRVRLSDLPAGPGHALGHADCHGHAAAASWRPSIPAIAAMPMPTRILMGISESLRTLFTSVGGWVVLVALVAGLVGAAALDQDGRAGCSGMRSA